METISINTNDNTAIVNITQELTLHNCEEVHRQILTVFENFQEIEIKLENIENIDLSGIQLLYSIRKTAQKRNKNVKLTLNLPKDIKALIEHAGFDEITKKN